MIRILIVDDHARIRALIRALLEDQDGWEVCGEAADGQAAVEQCVLLKPHLVVLDIHMPVRNGLDAARMILVRFPMMLILMVTMDGSPHFVLATNQDLGAGCFRADSIQCHTGALRHND